MRTSPVGHRLRVGAALGWRGFALAPALGLLLALQALFHPRRYELWTAWDVAAAWSVYFVEVTLIVAAVLAVVILVEQLRRPVLQLLLIAPAVLAAAVPLILVAHWRVTGTWSVGGWIVGETIKFGLVGLLLYGLRALHRRGEAARASANALEQDQAELELQVEAAQLQLLQAQVEPHFLFNTLANIRRLYRTEPTAGADAIDSLRTYLRAALPLVRRGSSTLADEVELVTAYLQLFKVRMGQRLHFAVDVAPSLRGLPYPPMLLMTLVENAIKHGIAPTELGGTIVIAATREGDDLVVRVQDDGVGFGAASGGTGVGLVNIRRQLSARFGHRARLTLEAMPEGGVVASIVTPWPTDAAAAVTLPQAAEAAR